MTGLTLWDHPFAAKDSYHPSPRPALVNQRNPPVLVLSALVSMWPFFGSEIGIGSAIFGIGDVDFVKKSSFYFSVFGNAQIETRTLEARTGGFP